MRSNRWLILLILTGLIAFGGTSCQRSILSHKVTMIKPVKRWRPYDDKKDRKRRRIKKVTYKSNPKPKY
jgi:hypothetical protein